MTVTTPSRPAGPSRLFADLDVDVELGAALGPRTWFAAGGAADALVRPRTVEALASLVRRCRRDDIPVRVLGSGANLLVDDEGVDGVVVLLDQPAFTRVEFNADGLVDRMRVFGGAPLERLIHDCARHGLRGIEQMSGIPSSLGGAIRMNAGGRFGAIGDSVEAVAVLGMDGEIRVLRRDEIHFGYRENDLPRGIVLWAVLRMEEADPVACRERVKEIFRYKKSTQPMGAASAGCMFRNPLRADGTRESAGRLIDLAGLKGRRVGAAFVSPEHGNFLAFDATAGVPRRTDDLRALVDEVREGVARHAGIELETEVVFWRRGEGSDRL